MGDNPKAQSFGLSKRESGTRKLIAHLRVCSVQETTIPNEWEEKRGPSCLPVDFDKILPLTKSRILSNSGNWASETEHFPELKTSVDIIRSVGGGGTLDAFHLARHLTPSFSPLSRRPEIRFYYGSRFSLQDVRLRTARGKLGNDAPSSSRQPIVQLRRYTRRQRAYERLRKESLSSIISYLRPTYSNLFDFLGCG